MKGYKQNFERLVQAYADVNDAIWEDEWRRADLCALLVRLLHKDQVQQLVGQLGHSHRPVYDRARLAEWWPEQMRRRDRSVREHSRVMKAVEAWMPQASQSLLEAWHNGEV